MDNWEEQARAHGWTPPPAHEPDWNACKSRWDEVWLACFYTSHRKDIDGFHLDMKAAVRVIIKHAEFWAEQADKMRGGDHA